VLCYDVLQVLRCMYIKFMYDLCIFSSQYLQR